MLIFDNSKKSNKLSTRHCNSNKFAYYEMFCEMLFFIKNLSQGNFLYCPVFLNFLYCPVFPPNKNLNTAHIPPEIK